MGAGPTPPCMPANKAHGGGDVRLGKFGVDGFGWNPTPTKYVKSHLTRVPQLGAPFFVPVCAVCAAAPPGRPAIAVKALYACGGGGVAVCNRVCRAPAGVEVHASPPPHLLLVALGVCVVRVAAVPPSIDSACVCVRFRPFSTPQWPKSSTGRLSRSPPWRYALPRRPPPLVVPALSRVSLPRPRRLDAVFGAGRLFQCR